MSYPIASSLLDGIVLAVVERESTYGYRITQDVQKVLDISESTLYPVLRRLQKDGCLTTYDEAFAGRNRRQQSGSIRYNLKAAQTLLREHVQRTSGLRTSARNVFHGRIEQLRASGIIVTVVLCTAGGLRVTAMITDESCKSLGLSKDMLVTASIKAPWIIIEPDQGQDKPPVATRNCFRGTVERVRQDEMLAEILVNLPDGSQACALHVRGESPIPPVGSSVWVIFKALSVILTLD